MNNTENNTLKPKLPLLIICGPTAMGKTKAASFLARKLNGEIVSADSRQIYIGMDIGTGKDKDEVNIFDLPDIKVKFNKKKIRLQVKSLNRIPVWLYDIVLPDRPFSVAHYKVCADEVISNIENRNKLPIIAGGTGLYIKSLQYRLSQIHIPPDNKFRGKIAGWDMLRLHQYAEKIFPGLLDSLNPSDRLNSRRVIRKLEIMQHNRKIPVKNEAGGIINDKEEFTSHRVLIIGLFTDLDNIYRRIDDRVDTRFRQGIIPEVLSLLDNGLNWDSTAMSSLGYRQWKDAIETKREIITALSAQPDRLLEIPEVTNALNLWKNDEHAYAKRQMTWFKKQKIHKWININHPDWEKILLNTAHSWYTNRNNYDFES